MTDPNHLALPEGEFLLYQTDDGQTRVEVRFDGETAWLTQASMAELYQTTPQNITQHIAAVYEDGELDEEATCKSHLRVREEGSRRVRRSLKHYSLPMILAIGYRVRSHRGTQFRRWATSRLEEYLIKGFTLDDERLKRAGGGNYLSDNELEALNRIVNAYLEFAELQAIDRKPMYMADWMRKLDDFLRLSDREVLTHAGNVSHGDAVARATLEYERFTTQRRELPSPVEHHFAEAITDVKHLEQQRRARTLGDGETKPKTRSKRKQ